ncbi:hypothetical protein GCM10028808_39540 [Spirosoma migulaei]
MKKPASQLEEWEWIERYWLGQLSADEKTFFEKMMQEDDRLARDANSLQFSIQQVEEARINAHARQTIERLQQTDRRQQRMVFQLVRFVGMAAAACVAFVLYLAFAPIALPQKDIDRSVLREFRQKYRLDSTDHLSFRQKQAFDRFYEGQSYLSEGQPQLAAKRFEEVLMFPELRPYFQEAAQWHLVICYLKTGQVTRAQRLYTNLEQADQYEMERLERWKIWWHLRRLAWFG